MIRIYSRNILYGSFTIMILLFSCNKENTKPVGVRYQSGYNNSPPEEEGVFDNFIGYLYAGYTEPEKIDLLNIKERKKLIALTSYNATGYFVYKGIPMGFGHDLLQLLAKELNVSLEIIIVHDTSEIFDMLNRGEGDLIADNLTITKQHDALVDFTAPLYNTRQVLIQKKPANWKKKSSENLEKMLVRNPIELIGKNVHVARESAYYYRLKNLSEELGGDIKIIEEPGNTGDEELIIKVSKGEIPFTVCNENVAMIHANHYPDIDIKTPISFDQRIAWAVRETSPQLRAAVNKWLKKIKKQHYFSMIYDKYYTNETITQKNINCKKISMCGRNISPFDELIIRHAKNIGWDWRLLASLIYQESQFNPKARSWSGASGLMQLMPGTAQDFGATNTEDPLESIQAGTKYLKWLEKYWGNKVPDKNERIKFIMASYNVGQEHIADAQRLARKYNKNPYVWDDNVAFFILQKSNQKYCTDPVVKYGYCRGTEPFYYVNNILERYEHYKKLIKEDV